MSEDSGKWAQFEDKAEASGYAQISNALLRCPVISLQAKGLYALLKSYAWQDAKTYPGIKRLCKDTGASDNTLKKYRDGLVEVGLLEVRKRGQGNTNLYIFKSLNKFLESQTGAKQESQTGHVLASHPSANNEDAVDEDAEYNSPEGAETSSAELGNEEENGHSQDEDFVRAKSPEDHVGKLIDDLEEIEIYLDRHQITKAAGNFGKLKAKGVAHSVLVRVRQRMVSEWPRVQLSPQDAHADITGERGSKRGNHDPDEKPMYWWVPTV